MRTGTVGSGLIGKTLARKFSAGGHSVLVANSRGLETIATGKRDHAVGMSASGQFRPLAGGGRVHVIAGTIR
jgi:predicted dinucleotide-binding enzyme